MAIYHLSAKVVGRSSGRSATGSAAYRAGQEIVDERTGLVHDYTRKGGVDHVEILAPDHAPEWAKDRATLWNEVEKAEKRKDAQLYREVEVALPRELSPEEMQELVRGFAREQFVERGMVADVAYHHLKEDNPHAHIMLTTREITPEGFGQKNRDWNRKESLKEWRGAWQVHANKSLELNGHDARIDHRTLEAQGIDRLPQVHLGPKVIEMEQRGVQTNIGERTLGIEKANAEIIDLQRHREAIEHERNREVETSKEQRRTGTRDRAASTSLSSAGRRQPGSSDPDIARGSGRDGASATREPGHAGTNQPAGQGEHQGIQAGSRNRAGAGEPSGESRQGVDVEAVGAGPQLERYRVDGSADRIRALAEPLLRNSEGRGELASIRQGLSITYEERSHHNREDHGMVDRSYLAARRQIEGMGCNAYEIGIRDRQGRMMNRAWSSQEILTNIAWLKRENAKGADIYIRPSGQQNQGILLIDDLSRGQVDRMKAVGLEPAVVVETSPQNMQAWVRVSETPIKPEVATMISQSLAKKFEGDPNSADWRHFGRLAGFTNQKPEHTTENGLHPWVLCHEASGKQASNGHQLVLTGEKALLEREVAIDKEMRLRAVRMAKDAGNRRDPTLTYQLSMKGLLERYGDQWKAKNKGEIDYSRLDFMISKEMAKRGYSAQDLEKALNNASPELPTRKAGHEQDYVRRTVEATFRHEEVKKHLEMQAKQQKTHRKDRGMDGPSM